MARTKGTYTTPTYRLHKPTGRAVVTIDGKDYYLGVHGTRESRQRYDRMIAEWLLRGRQGPAAADPTTATVSQVAAGFLDYRQSERRAAGGKDGKAITSMRWLCDLYGDTLANEFGSVQLQAIRVKMAGTRTVYFGRESTRTLCRKRINQFVHMIQAAFRWAASAGIVLPSVWHSLSTLRPWKDGECPARPDNPKVLPADPDDVEAVLEVANPVLAAMIRLQLYTGMRSGELCAMEAVHIDMGGPVWKYRPPTHKTQRHGVDRVILIGPQAQEVLRPFLLHLNGPIFRPAEADSVHFKVYATKGGPPRIGRVARTTKGRTLHQRFRNITYYNAILRACRLADKLAHLRNPDVPADKPIVNRWHSHQLRHAAATNLREKFGIDVAQAVLGHTSSAMTERYAKPSNAAAENAMRVVG